MPRIDLVVVVWSMVSAAGMTLAAVHLMAWMSERRRAGLAFVALSISVAAVALIELQLMRAPSPEAYATTLRWAHLVVLGLVLSVVALVRVLFPEQRNWLGLLAAGARIAAVAANFFSGGANLNFASVTGLREVTLFGSTIVVPLGVRNPWVVLGEAATVLLFFYIVDAAWSHARSAKHGRMRAVVLGGVVASFVGGAQVLAIAVNHGVFPIPYMISLPYLGVAAVMAWQLSRDMVKSTRLARELRESERRAELAARGARAGLWLWQLGENRMWADAIARDLHGVASDDVRGELEQFFAGIDPADRERVRALFQHGTEIEFEVEYGIVLPADGRRWLRTRGIIERDAAGRAIAVRGGSIDVSDRHEAEDRFRSVVAAAPTALLVIGPDNAITLANQRAEEMFGAAAGQLLGRRIATLFDIDEAIADQHGPAAAPMHEVRARRLAGDEFSVEVGLRELTSHGGRQLLASLIDVTARLEHEREMQRLREQFANASRLSLAGQLASTLAHELNQPLAAILRNAETAGILLEQPEPDLAELDAILDDIRSDDRRAGEIIEHMRSLLRGRGPVLSPVELPAMLRRVAAVVRHDAELRGVKLGVEAPGGLPTVVADPVQLQQVLLNLVYNSLHALEVVAPASRSIGLHARVVPDGIEVAVSDTGTGIEATALPRIFDPFFSTRADGMGMGLAICRSLVDAMGGRIEAGNAMGGGAVFRILLMPAVEAP